MKKMKKLALYCAIGSATAGLSYQALGAVGLEEIVVTARKREEAVQDIPVAVTAVTGEMFDRAAITNFEEATALTPGFNMSAASFSPLAPNLSMRGSAQNAVTPTDDPSVGIYVDGVYIARPYGIGVDLLDLADIQALKGPQGTLFGRNSTAGALLLNTNDPELGEFMGSVSGTLGDELTSGEIILNVPLGEMFALRVAHKTSDRDDWVTNAPQSADNPLYTRFDDPPTVSYAPYKPEGSSEIGGYDSDITRVKLRFAPTDNLDMVLSHEEFERDQAGPIRETRWLAGEFTNLDFEDDVINLGFDPHIYAETETDIFTLTYDSDVGELKFIASNRDYRSLNESDYDGGDLASSNLCIARVDGNCTRYSVRRHGSWGRSAGEQTTYELQWVTSLMDDRLDLTAGATYFEEQSWYFDYSYGGNIYNPTDTFIITNFGAAGGNAVEIDDSAVGFYAQGTFHINDVSNLTLGVRRSSDDKSAKVYGSSAQVAIAQLPTWDFDAYVGNPTGYYRRGGGNLTIIDQSETFNSTDWLVSYDYKLSEDVMVYGKVSTGFRAGGFNGRGVDSLDIEFVFDPEELIEYELGLKGDFLDGQLRWNTAVFMNETDDKQFTVLIASSGDGPPGTTTKNAGKAEAQGFETELTYLLTENWGVSASYSYIDSEIKSLGGQDCLNPANIVDSVPDACIPDALLVPESEWTLSLNYDQEFDSFKVAGTAMYHWIDEIQFATKSAQDYLLGTAPFGLTLADMEEALAASTSESYGTLNLNLTFSSLDDMYNLTLWSKNALDERAITSTVINNTGGAYQYVTGTVNEPRTYGATVKVNF